MTLQRTIGRCSLRPVTLAVATLSLTVLTPNSYAADAITFNGTDSYAQIQAWQPKGNYKVIVWLGDLNPDPGYKTMLLSNSANSEYLMVTHNSVQLQFGRSYPGIWGKFNFAKTKYLEIEIHDGKMVASDGETRAQINNASIEPTDSRFDWLFRRGGGFSSGTIEGLALMDLTTPDNSRAFAFDQQRGMVEVGKEALQQRLVNVDHLHWQSAQHTITNPDPDHFDNRAWLAAFYPDDTPSPPTPEPDPTPDPPLPSTQPQAVRFDGHNSYGSMPSWVPSGKFTIIAHLNEAARDSSLLNMLLTSSNTTEYLSFSHRNVQGKWGSSFPGIWNRFAFDQTKYLKLTIDHGSLTASDGKVEASVNSAAIDPTRVGYDWVFRRGNGYFDSALQSLTLIDHLNPTNSRSYAFDPERGMVEVNGHHGQLHHIGESDWLPGQHQLQNPAPNHFADADWQAVYGDQQTPAPDPAPEPNPTPDPDPDPEPEPTPQYSASFNGNNSYGSIPQWRPTGSFKVIAHLAEINADASALTFLLSDSSNSNYLSFSHTTAKGQWGRQYPGIYGKFRFNQTKYVEYTVEPGKLTVSDGQTRASTNNSGIDPTALSYDWVFRRGGAYSAGALQSLTLLDLNTPSNSRSYAFNPERGMVDVNGNDGQLHNIGGDDFQPQQAVVTNPAPEHFTQDKWDATYGGKMPVIPEPDPTPNPEPTPDPEPQPDPTPEPDPQPGKPLLGANERQIRFNGSNAYFDFADWQPQGEHRVVAWLQDLNEQLTYVASGGTGYLAVTKDDFVARFNGQPVRLDNRFDFATTGYVDILIDGDQATVSDGKTSVTIEHQAIANQRYDSAMRHGSDYSHGSLQGLALIDYSSDARVRAYSFNSRMQIVENSQAPSGQNRLYNVANSDWQQVSHSVRAPDPLIRSQADWDQHFAHYARHGRPMLDGTIGNDWDQYAWHGHYWLRAYITMAETYGDDKYLDYAVELVDHMIHYTDSNRAARGELNIHRQPYSSAPKAYLNNRDLVGDGWRRPYSGYRLAVLSDGQILNPIMRLVDHIKANNKQAYMAKADHYLQLAETVINNHNTSFSNDKNAAIQGAYFYVNDQNDRYGNSGLYSNPLPFNHNFTMAVAMIYVNKWRQGGEPALKQKVHEIVGFFNDNLVFNSDGSCSWNYAYDVNGNNKVEDTSHGHMDVGFLLAANQEGYVSDAVIQCMVTTFTDKVFVAPGIASYDVNGDGISSEMDQIALTYDWADLAKYDDRIVQMNRFILHNFGEPDWSRAYFGWATQLKWEKR
ncbi:hypothetical protein [Ferrimonas senticii]|uniref:hypothetical protein n=1 Tax=Ferrimonas senticii TaxID=394566 RepID=UPI001969DDA8|nr:hypothetical protein [Ferrimonas senticii]